MAVPTADDQAKQQQVALLQAIAEQGSRGKAMYDQQAAQAQAQKQAGVDAALSAAENQGGPGSVGAPAGLRAHLGAQAGAVGDARANDVSAASTNFNQDQAAMSSANDTYMNQLGAAIPLVRVRAEEAAAEQQRQIALQKQLADMDLQRSQISLQQSQIGLQSQKDAAGYARDAAARDAASGSGTGTKAPSVAQQKYDDQQAQQAQQDSVLKMAQGANQPTQSAFVHIMSTGGRNGGPVQSLQEALDALRESLDASHQAFGTGGWAGSPQAPLYHDFGADVNPDQLAAFFNAFFATPGSGGDGTGDASGSGAVVRRS